MAHTPQLSLGLPDRSIPLPEALPSPGPLLAGPDENP
jgi:hypothetical protein